MIRLIDYIKSCLNPRGTTEVVESLTFVKSVYDNLVQDGIYICNNVLSKDKGSISDYIQLYDSNSITKYVFIIRKVIKEIQWLNDDGTFNWNHNDPLYKRLLPPPIETVNHTFIIEEIVKSYVSRKNTDINVNTSPLLYIEYGVRSGDNFNTIYKLNKNGNNVGVDMKILPHLQTEFRDNTYVQLYEMMTDTFSETILPNLQPDIVFIDADHNSSSVIKDFDYIFKHLKVGGYIILHDTYPCMPELLDPMGCSDCYKTPLYIKNKYLGNTNTTQPRLSILTLPLNPGVSIVQKLM
jgi:hypothetical protein